MHFVLFGQLMSNLSGFGELQNRVAGYGITKFWNALSFFVTVHKKCHKRHERHNQTDYSETTAHIVSKYDIKCRVSFTGDVRMCVQVRFPLTSPITGDHRHLQPPSEFSMCYGSGGECISRI